MEYPESQIPGMGPSSTNPFRVIFGMGVPAVLLTIMLVVLGFAGSGTDLATVRDAARPPALVGNPLTDIDHAVPLPFGMRAKNECELDCYRSTVERAMCVKNCGRLTVDQFARRIQLDEVTPKDAAEDIISACRVERAIPGAQTRKNGLAFLVELLAVTPAEFRVYDRNEALRRYALFSDAERRVPAVQADSPKPIRVFAANVKTAACLRQAVAATQLAVIEVSQHDDLYSESYYQKLEDDLLGELGRVERELAPRARELLPPEAG